MIKIVSQAISQQELQSFIGQPFSDMIKFVVDVKKDVLALGGELHSDAEAVLLEAGSKQSDLWGGNLYPSQPKDKRIEYSSLINIRPSVKNTKMEVMDEKIRSQMAAIVLRLLP